MVSDKNLGLHWLMPRIEPLLSRRRSLSVAPPATLLSLSVPAPNTSVLLPPRASQLRATQAVPKPLAIRLRLSKLLAALSLCHPQRAVVLEPPSLSPALPTRPLIMSLRLLQSMEAAPPAMNTLLRLPPGLSPLDPPPTLAVLRLL